MDIVSIFQILLLVAATVLCVFLIFYLNRIARSVRAIETKFDEISSAAKPLIDSLTSLSNNLEEITSESKNQVHIVKDIVSEIKERVELILGLEEKIREGVERPVIGLIKNLSALANGVDTFWKSLKK